MRQARVVLIVPAHNEAQRLAGFLGAIPQAVSQTVVVDDGSIDETLTVARTHGAHVIRFDARGGIDRALRAGMDYALEDEADVIMIMAGNGKDDPAQIPRLLRPILEHDYDFVQGSRYLPGGQVRNMPWHRVFATRLYPWLLHAATGFDATDGTNGFRAFKSSILRDPRIDLKQDWLGFASLEPYLAMKVIQLGYRMVEVPVSKLYPRTRDYRRYTKIRPGVDWWNVMKPMVYLTLGLKQ